MVPETVARASSAPNRPHAAGVSAEYLDVAYGPLPMPVVLWGAGGRLIYANVAAETLIGADLTGLRGMEAACLLQPEHGQDLPLATDELLAETGLCNGQMRLTCPDGRQCAVEVLTVGHPGGPEEGFLSVLVDQTAERQTEVALQVERGLLRTLLDAMPDHIYFKDRNSRFIRANRAQAAFFGVDNPEQELGKTDFDFYSHDVAEMLYTQEQSIMSTGQPLIGMVEDHTPRAHRPYFLQSTKIPVMHNHEVIGIVGISRDITELKLVQDRLAHQAMHDALTDLPNRALLLDRLDQVLRTAEREHTTFALCLLDLDRFKEVNDTLGHQCGDQLLREVATRISAVLHEADTVARLGGDEFALLLPRTSLEAAIERVTAVRRALEQSLNLDGAHATISGSIGIALYPEHATDTAALLVHADVAMYTAKQAGSGYAVYDIADGEHSPDHLALPREFRYALAHNELFLQYQPLVDITEGRVTTVEALIRWQHPRHGIIPPSCILPLADRIGVLDALTDWVLDTALAQCRAWHDHGLPLRVAVNTSSRTLQDVTLPHRVAALLLRHQVPPADVTLEITEEALMSDPRQVLSVLVALDKLGVHLAIDDFGTGFSSLAYLRKIPIDTIKIDRSFVRDMAPSMQDEAIVRSVIELGHSLGMHVVAEGIENQETLDRLAELSCDGGQGFYMSQPVAAEAIEAWLSASPWHGPLQES